MAASEEKNVIRAPKTSQELSKPQEDFRFIALNIESGSHKATRQTVELVKEVGGSEAIYRMTKRFYEKFFQNPHLDVFVSSHEHPHGERLGNWIIEKMGGGDVWTTERRERPPSKVTLYDGSTHIVHDRTSAHSAAWRCAKRPAAQAGRRFKLPDTRIWMRLMFWAAREEGLFQSKTFESWYIRFIGHFVRVYEHSAPVFARESARWSENPDNVKKYIENGNQMEKKILLPYELAVRDLPSAEVSDWTWPYGPMSI
mmetsp:Transcript_38327/g.53343  ORF Transcript_38327/g.53343 Transcript_38327/m.53343 type:complete len:256 (-) Transcript_38327:136-903(-)|eukprot:CAMPEP_0201487554 /NCGR_PEP_ID=MMETSP0151_2-20130828/13855_1 /ASSEMBLY_ACC=CAM_ASM_000257 /TAXON_ID=200890 /ORGANISM="Paramoeba atlantica, Strain 621/1 / CCAP 1560/9" /LENGTH=255 /DNA_ID=CAMNT_0047872619 /DNA_START=134 /DNA_END=901 /DNA_ORIENTATION=+